MFDFFYFLNEKHGIIKSLNYDGIGQGGGGGWGGKIKYIKKRCWALYNFFFFFFLYNKKKKLFIKIFFCGGGGGGGGGGLRMYKKKFKV